MSFLDEFYDAQDQEPEESKPEPPPLPEPTIALDRSELDDDDRPRRPPRIEISGAILAVDIGTEYTRAVLLQAVDGTYRFVGRGQAVTTDRAPWHDVLMGVTEAVEQITEATGHQLLDPENGMLILPEESPFRGVGGFAATASAGEPVRALLVGLMPSVSVASGQRIAASSYLQVVDVFSLSDRRSQAKQIDAVIQAHPNLILIVGGTDGGARESLIKQIETIELACSLIEPRKRPVVLYAGNKSIQDEVVQILENPEVDLRVFTADNVRPTLGMEYLESAEKEMEALFNAEKSANTGGFTEIRSWTRNGIVPTAHALSTTVKVVGKLYGEAALGIDVGSSATTVAAYVEDTPYLNVFDELGMGRSAKGIVGRVNPQAVARWISQDVTVDEVNDYLWNRSIYPHAVPATEKDLEIEMAIAREMLRSALAEARKSWRGVRQYGLIPTFPTILLSGSLLGSAPHPGLSAMIALDTLLPTEMTRIYVDPYGMAPTLGAIAAISPRATVQTLETGAFIDLGMVISVLGRSRRGDIVVRGGLKLKDKGEEREFEVPFGDFTLVPLEPGQEAELTIQTNRVEVNLGGRRRHKVTVTGGELGLIFDARGRPWRFPRNSEERRKWLVEWRSSITGGQL